MSDCRVQRIVNSSADSGWRPAASSAPQRLILGPILLKIFISDREEGIKYSSSRVADDVKLGSTFEVASSSFTIYFKLEYKVNFCWYNNHQEIMLWCCWEKRKIKKKNNEANTLLKQNSFIGNLANVVRTDTPSQFPTAKQHFYSTSGLARAVKATLCQTVCCSFLFSCINMSVLREFSFFLTLNYISCPILPFL